MNTDPPPTKGSKYLSNCGRLGIICFNSFSFPPGHLIIGGRSGFRSMGTGRSTPCLFCYLLLQNILHPIYTVLVSVHRKAFPASGGAMAGTVFKEYTHRFSTKPKLGLIGFVSPSFPVQQLSDFLVEVGVNALCAVEDVVFCLCFVLCLR